MRYEIQAMKLKGMAVAAYFSVNNSNKNRYSKTPI
jgi:hypothetical protein